MVDLHEGNSAFITIMEGDLYFWTEGGGWVLLEDIESYIEEEYPWGVEDPLAQLLKLTHIVCDEYLTLKDEYDLLLERYTMLESSTLNPCSISSL